MIIFKLIIRRETKITFNNLFNRIDGIIVHVNSYKEFFALFSSHCEYRKNLEYYSRAYSTYLFTITFNSSNSTYTYGNEHYL